MRFLLILLILVLSWPAQFSFADAARGKLLKIVALSRHGVRAPTEDKHILELWSQKVWPRWPVKKGDLTPRGSQLVTAMWMNLKDKLTEDGIISQDMCPSQNSIYIRADTDERTRATAAAILEGLGKNCKLGYAVLENTKIDPLFHPVKAGLYHFNPVSTATDILANAHGSLHNVQEEFANIINLIGTISGQPASKLCARFAAVANCQLADLPNAISVSPDGSSIKLMGSLDIASSMAEIFLLEYAQWPGQDAGWGQINARVLEEILPVHAKIFDVVNRAPLVAWARGSSLLTEINSALQGTHTDNRCNEAKLVVFVGHDTNIANLGSLMDLNWHAKPYPANGIPPASVLFFELWEKEGKKEIVVRFYAQPLKALHKETGIDPVSDFAPEMTMVTTPSVAGEAKFDLEHFQKLVNFATEGAPIAPVVNPPLSYQKIFDAAK